MGTDYQTIRATILDYLREQFPGGKLRRGADAQCAYILTYLKDKGIQPATQGGEDPYEFGLLVASVIHDLYLERIIVTGTAVIDGYNSAAFEWPYFRLTVHGRKVLEDECSPYDPERYLEQLKSKVPGIDDEVLAYVKESLTCLKNHCIFAAAVMIGCASEKSILALIVVFGSGISDPAKKEKFLKDTDKLNITVKFAAFRTWLDQVAGDLPKDLKNGLGRNLDGIFHLIRETRNAAGHPQKAEINRNDVSANLVLFVGYCKFILELTDYFTTNPPNF